MLVHARPAAARGGAAAGAGDARPRRRAGGQRASRRRRATRISLKRGIATTRAGRSDRRTTPRRSTRRSAPIAPRSRTRRCSCSTRRSRRRSPARTGAAAWCTRATWCAPTTPRRSSSSTRSRRSTCRSAVPEAQLPELKRYMAPGHARASRRCRPTSTARRRSGTITFIDNAVDPTTGTIKVKGTFPNDRSPAVAGPVRQRQRDAVDRPERDRRADARRCRPASRAPTSSSSSRIRRSSCGRSRSSAPAASSRSSRAASSAGETVVTDGQLRLVAGTRVSVKNGAGAGGHVMNLSALFIKRPVTTTLIMLGHHRVRRDGVPAAAGQRSADRRLPHHPGRAPACPAPARRRWPRRSRCRSRSSSRRSPA